MYKLIDFIENNRSSCLILLLKSIMVVPAKHEQQQSIAYFAAPVISPAQGMQYTLTNIKECIYWWSFILDWLSTNELKFLLLNKTDFVPHILSKFLKVMKCRIYIT